MTHSHRRRLVDVLACQALLASPAWDDDVPFWQKALKWISEEVHYTSVKYGGIENEHPDWTQPGSLLYRRTPQGMKAIGVMMTASNQAGPAELDARARFGFNGSIDTQVASESPGGFWIPVAFGWMTHVYPGETGARVWGGEPMAAGAHMH